MSTHPLISNMAGMGVLISSGRIREFARGADHRADGNTQPRWRGAQRPRHRLRSPAAVAVWWSECYAPASKELAGVLLTGRIRCSISGPIFRFITRSSYSD
jgi:hypothetical protein